MHFIIRWFSVLAFLCFLFQPGCIRKDCGGNCEEEEPAPVYYTSLKLVDEEGNPVSDAVYTVGETTFNGNKKGMIKVGPLQHPIVGMVTSPATIPEPVTLGWTDVDQTVTVQLLESREGRWVYHAGGDAMFGRRYLEPEEGLPLLSAYDNGESAVELVRYITDVMASADFSTINLETVVGDLDESDVYPFKLWILQSPPNAMAALQALGIDLVGIGNNHIYDYLETGISTTMKALDNHNLPYIGAGHTKAEADKAAIATIGGVKVATLAYSTVDGDYVNDHYPTDEDEVPDNLDANDAWMWEKLEWGYSGNGIEIPVLKRRIGTAWVVFEQAESQLDEEGGIDLWNSLVEVYPAMQDTAARRGHGGATAWKTSEATAMIEKTKAEADLLIVQLHSGSQFVPAPSESLRKNARAAIDAGADMVLSHHPHQLQGLEWYKDKLIFYSMGNFIFEQEFFATKSSAMLRTVWDGNKLVQARVIPLQLERYVPVFLADQGADFVLSDLWRMSLLGSICTRGPASVVYTEPIELDEWTRPVHFEFERHTARIELDSPTPTIETIFLEPGELYALPSCAALQRKIDDQLDLQIGRELFAWGGFEDVDNDDQVGDMTLWYYEATADRQLVSEGCATGQACVRMHRTSTNESNLMLRSIARIPIPEYRFYHRVDDKFVPTDGNADYSVRLNAKATAQNEAYVRLDLYHFDDSDPTIEPESSLIREVILPMNMPADKKWHELLLDVAPQDLVYDDPSAPINYTLPYLFVPPTKTGEAYVWFDDFEFIEWRNPGDQPEGYGIYNYLRNTGDDTIEVKIETVDGCPAGK